MGNKREKGKDNGILFLLWLLFCAAAWMLLLIEPAIVGQPYNNTSIVNTTVNITNAAPFVWNVLIPPSINLIAYDNTTVQCNTTIYDFDNNTNTVNASLHFSAFSPIGASDQNFRYINSSCARVSPLDYFTNYSCTFAVNYFANNGTWYCNVTATDTSDAISTNQSNAGTINPLVAIKTDALLDFGNLGVNQVSGDTLANVTNAGNRDINISVMGYGATEGDGLAMVCDSGSISVDYERYDYASGSSYGFMTQLTSSSVMINNFYVQQRTDEALDSINSTYWQIMIPVGAGGVCNGKILFAASDRGN